MNITDMIGITPATANETNTAEETETTSTPFSDSTNRVNEEFDTFLNLLTAQIRNQDPLAPLESTQFVEQLATFSGLELQATGNNFLEDIATMLAQQTYGPPNANTASANAETKSTVL